MFRYSVVLVLALGGTGPAAAASWADTLFEEVSKDFGSVPRGPVLSHSFRVVNKTRNPVSIGEIRVSCGCVTASALKYNLKPGEETAVVVQMNTTRFTGIKTVTVYVPFTQPSSEEVRLWVQANSRDDVMISPDTLAFGHVKRGATPTATATITFLGTSAVQVTEVRCDSNYVEAALKELRRQDAEVTFQLTARLHGDAPVGRWYSDIWLKTNSPVMPRVRVPLTVEIESFLSVSPASVSLGQLKPGATAERKVIVRGTQPFRVLEVEGADAQLTVQDSTSESKTVHVLTVTFRPTKAGDLERTLRLKTDLKEDGAIDFQARAQVVP
jgi:hypothetical protein